MSCLEFLIKIMISSSVTHATFSQKLSSPNRPYMIKLKRSGLMAMAVLSEQNGGQENFLVIGSEFATTIYDEDGGDWRN
jgi:hypothetical protein